MSKGKLGFVIVVAVASFFLLGCGIWMNGKLKEMASRAEQKEVDSQISLLTNLDLTIYWIGDVPSELSALSPVMSVISPGSVNSDNMPIMSSSFHVVDYNQNGDVTGEAVPRDYSYSMIIVLYHVSGLSADEQSVLSDCISRNGVPVLAIGSDSIALVRSVLMYSQGSFAPDDSFYYHLGEGYKDYCIDNSSIKAGGVTAAKAIVDYISGCITVG